MKIFVRDIVYSVTNHSMKDLHIQRTMHLDTAFTFGKYRGKLLSCVRRNNLPYIRWCKDNIPDLKFVFTKHPIQYKKDDSWREVSTQAMRIWASGYLASQGQIDIDTHIEF